MARPGRRGHRPQQQSSGRSHRPLDDCTNISQRRRSCRSVRIAVNASRDTGRERTLDTGGGTSSSGVPHKRVPSGEGERARAPLVGVSRQAQGSRSRGRGLEITRPAWLITRRDQGDRWQRQTGPAAGGHVGSNRSRRHGQVEENNPSGLQGLVLMPAERSLRQGSQPAGRGLHRTVPAWQSAGRVGDGYRATRRVGGLQQDSALVTTDNAGNGSNNITDRNGRIPRQGGNAHDTETRPSYRSGLRSASPPRIIGARRRRSSSEESSSTRPRSRSRHISPSPRRATGGD